MDYITSLGNAYSSEIRSEYDENSPRDNYQNKNNNAGSQLSNPIA